MVETEPKQRRPRRVPTDRLQWVCEEIGFTELEAQVVEMLGNQKQSEAAVRRELRLTREELDALQESIRTKVMAYQARLTSDEE